MPADRLYLLFSLVVISCGDGVVRAAPEGGVLRGQPTLLAAEDNAIATVPDGSITGQTALYQVQTPSALTPGTGHVCGIFGLGCWFEGLSSMLKWWGENVQCGENKTLGMITELIIISH